MYVLRFISEIKKIKLKLNKVVPEAYIPFRPTIQNRIVPWNKSFCKVHFENTTQLKQQSNCGLSEPKTERSAAECRFVVPQLCRRQQKEFYVFPFYLFPQDFSDKFCFARSQVSYWLLLYALSICGLRFRFFFYRGF